MTGGSGERASSAIVTIPNAVSAARILLIPAFVALIVDRRSTFAGLLLFGAVISTDWIDGYVARRSGQISEVGKVLDPTADRLAIAAGLVALVARGAFPLWAALLVLVRDGLVLAAGAAFLAARRVRVEVRIIGKVATFSLMAGVGWIAWGELGYPFSAAAAALGWTTFAVAITEYYLAAVLYARDLARALDVPST